jgi:hypothetical protein
MSIVNIGQLKPCLPGAHPRLRLLDWASRA